MEKESASDTINNNEAQINAKNVDLIEIRNNVTAIDLLLDLSE